MIKQELEFFPYTAPLRHEIRRDPNHKAEHAWKSCVSDDDEEASKKQRQDSFLEGNHRIGSKCKAKIVEQRRRCKDTPMTRYYSSSENAKLGALPPDSGLTVTVNNAPPSIRAHDPW